MKANYKLVLSVIAFYSYLLLAIIMVVQQVSWIIIIGSFAITTFVYITKHQIYVPSFICALAGITALYVNAFDSPSVFKEHHGYYTGICAGHYYGMFITCYRK